MPLSTSARASSWHTTRWMRLLTSEGLSVASFGPTPPVSISVTSRPTLPKRMMSPTRTRCLPPRMHLVPRIWHTPVWAENFSEDGSSRYASFE